MASVWPSPPTEIRGTQSHLSQFKIPDKGKRGITVEEYSKHINDCCIGENNNYRMYRIQNIRMNQDCKFVEWQTRENAGEIEIAH